MRCQICGRQPRQFDLFGGNYWKSLFTDRWLCPVCYYWASRLLGVF